jgi:hypothetical protein
MAHCRRSAAVCRRQVAELAGGRASPIGSRDRTDYTTLMRAAAWASVLPTLPAFD